MIRANCLGRNIGRAGRAFPISAIDGMGGPGKTALVVHVVHRLTAHNPDGQIVADIAGPARRRCRRPRVWCGSSGAFEPLMQAPEDVGKRGSCSRSICMCCAASECC
jgi:hypothetical protein